MTNPTIDQIRAMSPEARAALHRRSAAKLGRNILLLTFVKVATPRLLGVIAKGMLHNAAR